jgi:hypothetical protein
LRPSRQSTRGEWFISDRSIAASISNGWTRSRLETLQQFNALIERRHNVSFHGRYDNDDLPTILGNFASDFCPIAPGTR